MISTSLLPVLITTFLASAVEATEMVTIVVGVGATRGWRSTIIVAVSGFGVLAVTVVVLGAALSQIPIGPLQLIVGTLLTSFGTFWSVEGLGVNWPASDGTIVALLLLYVATALTFITVLRRRAPQIRAAA